MENLISIRGQRCQTPSCGSHVVAHGQKRKRFKCTACEKTWHALRGSPLSGLKSAPEKISEAEKLLTARVSIRKIAAHVGVSQSTVLRWEKRFTQYNYRDFFPPTRA